MMSKLSNCRYCGRHAEHGLLPLDEEWLSCFIGCSNDLCDNMISVEIIGNDKALLHKSNKIIQNAWNDLQVQAFNN